MQIMKDYRRAATYKFTEEENLASI